MEIVSSHRSYSEADVDALIVPVFDGETPHEGLLSALNDASHGAVAAAFETGEVEGQAVAFVWRRQGRAFAARADADGGRGRCTATRRAGSAVRGGLSAEWARPARHGERIGGGLHNRPDEVRSLFVEE